MQTGLQVSESGWWNGIICSLTASFYKLLALVAGDSVTIKLDLDLKLNECMNLALIRAGAPSTVSLSSA